MNKQRVRPASVLACLIILVIGVGTGCSNGTPPTSIADDALRAPENGLIGGQMRAPGLMACAALPEVGGTAVIGPEGGQLQFGPHRLIVPAGALSQSVEITALAPSARVNHIQFAPHGLQFQRDVQLVVSYAHCSGVGSLLPKNVVYTDGFLNILEILPSTDDVRGRRVTGTLDHFSNYSLAW